MEYIASAAFGFLSCAGLVTAAGVLFLVLRRAQPAQVAVPPASYLAPVVITRRIEWGNVRHEVEAYRQAGWRILAVKNGLPGDKLVELLLEHDRIG